eukprot:m.54092 g.54092  ORF g.54092 m.54092 type:complete len:277 (+) comp12844_c0_seq1:118-948(+)
MSVVTVSNGVQELMLSHAFSAEKFEIMGLLIGERLMRDDGSEHMDITHIKLLTRSDKKKDRVEISPAQQTDAAIEAERLSAETGRELTVLGWYHSHPHITVWPSHVDLRTQHSYQLMAPSWLGIIVACFQQDASQAEHVEIVAFRSVFDEYTQTHERITVPIVNMSIAQRFDSGLLTAPSSFVSKLLNISLQEEQQAYDAALREQKRRDLTTTASHLERQGIQADHIYTLTTLLTDVADPLLRSLALRLRHLEEKVEFEKERLSRTQTPVQGNPPS